MEFNEKLLSTIAMVWEMLFPLVLIGLYFVRVSLRPLLVSILGSITPLILCYLYVVFGFNFLNLEDYLFAYSAMWQMSFIPYCVLIVVGALLGAVVLKKSPLIYKYILGAFFGPIFVVAVVLVLNWFA